MSRPVWARTPSLDGNVDEKIGLKHGPDRSSSPIYFPNSLKIQSQYPHIEVQIYLTPPASSRFQPLSHLLKARHNILFPKPGASPRQEQNPELKKTQEIDIVNPKLRKRADFYADALKFHK